MKLDKKAQVASTLGWFVATLVIFLILLVFLFFSGVVGVQKFAKNSFIDIHLNEGGQRNLVSMRFLTFVLESDFKGEKLRKILSRANFFVTKGTEEAYRAGNSEENYGDILKEILNNKNFFEASCYDYLVVLPNNLCFFSFNGEKGSSDFSSLSKEFFYKILPINFSINGKTQIKFLAKRIC